MLAKFHPEMRFVLVAAKKEVALQNAFENMFSEESISFILPRLSWILFYDETFQAFKTFVKICHKNILELLSNFLDFTVHLSSYEVELS